MTGSTLSRSRRPAPAPRIAAAVSVPCAEPFGTAADLAGLAEALREALPGIPLPGAVLTLPPPLTFLRPMTLPVTDLPRARAIHLAALEGNLPIEDEDILSDLLPAPPEGSGAFFAVAARRSFVENASEHFGAAGIRVDRVVTDPVALLLLVAGAAGSPRDGIYLSTFNDILLLRVSGGGVTAARQFPQAMADRPEEILGAVREAAGHAGTAPPAVFLIGEASASLTDLLPDAERIPLPEGVLSADLAAYGAALAPLRPDVGGGFSLRTSAEAALERDRERRWTLATEIAAGVAVLLALGAFWFAGWTEGTKAARARALVKNGIRDGRPGRTQRGPAGDPDPREARLPPAPAEGARDRRSTARRHAPARLPGASKGGHRRAGDLDRGGPSADRGGRGERRAAGRDIPHRAGKRVRSRLLGDRAGVRGKRKGNVGQIHHPRREEGGPPCFVTGRSASS